MASVGGEMKTELEDGVQSAPQQHPDKDSHNPHFQVDMNLIPAAQLKEEDDDLAGLGVGVFNQEELEQG